MKAFKIILLTLLIVLILRQYASGGLLGTPPASPTPAPPELGPLAPPPAAADCLVPGIGEIIGGSQREERLDVLLERMQELGLKEEDYWWYLDLRRYGSCRHAGFGLGFERMVMYLTGVSNIRDVELHPRTTGNADF